MESIILGTLIVIPIIIGLMFSYNQWLALPDKFTKDMFVFLVRLVFLGLMLLSKTFIVLCAIYLFVGLIYTIYVHIKFTRDNPDKKQFNLEELLNFSIEIFLIEKIDNFRIKVQERKNKIKTEKEEKEQNR